MILNEIDNAYFGDEQVDKIYLGADEVWTNTPPVQDTPLTIEVTSPGDIKFTYQTVLTGKPVIDANFHIYKNGSLLEDISTSGWSTSGAGVTYSAATGDVFEIIASGTNDTLGVSQDINVTNSFSMYMSYLSFSGTTAGMELSGNILSLLTDQYNGRTTFAPDYTFKVYPGSTDGKTYYTALFNNLFRNISTTFDASRLKLPTDILPFCYASMFYTSSGLTAAPELPCTSALERYAYARMFRGTSITSIKCLTTDVSALYCTLEWLMYVPSTGNFIKNSAMSSWTTGNNGIPSGWTVVDA